MKIIKGNILETECYQIVHGCNAQGVMGSGVAKAIREAYPGAYDVYRNVYEMRGLRLGEIVTYISEHGEHIIHNLITQYRYGKDGKRYVNYAALASGLTLIAQRSTDLSAKYRDIAIPAIGAGLGGGNLGFIQHLVDDIEAMYPKIQFVMYILD